MFAFKRRFSPGVIPHPAIDSVTCLGRGKYKAPKQGCANFPAEEIVGLPCCGFPWMLSW